MALYAFVSNEWKGLIHSTKQLEKYKMIFSYPKFIKCHNEEDGLSFIKSNSKEYIKYNYTIKERKSNGMFCEVSYAIGQDKVYVNVDTSRVGNIRMSGVTLFGDTPATVNGNKLRFILPIVGLKDWSISNHVVAIEAIINSLNKYINICIVCPDISVYLKVRYLLASNQKGTLGYRIEGRKGDTYWVVKHRQ